MEDCFGFVNQNKSETRWWIPIDQNIPKYDLQSLTCRDAKFRKIVTQPVLPFCVLLEPEGAGYNMAL